MANELQSSAMGQKVNDIIMLLCKGMDNRKRYYADHPRVDFVAGKIQELVEEYYAAAGDDALRIDIANGYFLYEGARSVGPSIAGKTFLQFAAALYCGGFTFRRGLSSTDIKKFFDIAALRTLPVKKHADARILFNNYGIHLILIDDPSSEEARNPRGKASARGARDSQKALDQGTALFYQEIFDVVSQAYGNAALDRKLDIEKIRSMCQFMLGTIEVKFADVMQFVHYADYDSYSVGHAVRVSSLAMYLGTKLQWPKNALLAIGAAGLLHDIGKSRIPEKILQKKGSLTEEELEIVHLHPHAGAEILLMQKGITDLDVALCWGHHLRHDGGGYPDQPAWAAKHPATSLLHVCDVFEALTAVRPYKTALQPQAAYGLMLADRGNFHPGMLAAFIASLGLYPPGTYVRLSDRRVGVVISSSELIDRPRVKIIRSELGEPLYLDEQYEIALSERDNTRLTVEQPLLEYME